MKRKNKFWVFVLLIAMMLSISSPVLAEDDLSTAGAVGGQEQNVTSDAIDNTTEPALDNAGEGSTEPTDPGLQAPNNAVMSKSPAAADRTVKAVSTTIPGFTVTGSPDNDFNIIKDEYGKYKIFVTGGSLSIQGGTTAAITIEVIISDGTEVILDNIDSPDLNIDLSKTATGSGDIVVKGKNIVKKFTLYSGDGNFNVAGKDNASIISQNLMSIVGNSIDIKDISFLSKKLEVYTRNISFTKITFDIDNLGSFLVEGKLSLIGCKGEIRFQNEYSSSSDFNFAGLSADDLYIKMNQDENLKFTAVTRVLHSFEQSVVFSPKYPIAVNKNPSLVNTTITTPTGGYFKTFQHEVTERVTGALNTYFMVADESGNMAQNVVFSGNPAPAEKDTFTQKVVKEPKTADASTPWALATAMILALITLAFVLKQRFVKVK